MNNKKTRPLRVPRLILGKQRKVRYDGPSITKDNRMRQDQKAPLFTAFGIPLKPLIVLIFFLGILLIVFGPIDVKKFVPHKPNTSSTEQHHREDKPQTRTTPEIIATPEMIQNVFEKLKNEKRTEIESAAEKTDDTNLHYILWFNNGGSVEASSIKIKPDLVTIIAENGIEMVVARSSIRKIVTVEHRSDTAEER